MTVTTRIVRGNAMWWCLLIALCLLLLAPLTLADVPPLLDYPNHMARMFILAFIPTDPVFAQFYTARWSIIPNLALDLTVPPLLRIFPIDLVGRAVVGLILLLPVFGAVAYHRALTGRLSYWPLGSVLFVYNGALLRGFLNFIASVGLALLLAAFWIVWRDRRSYLAVLVCVAGAAALFFCHLIGLLLFAILIGGHELLVVRTDPLSLGTLGRRIGALIGVFAVPVGLYAVSHLGQMPNEAEFRSVTGKVHAALMPVMNYLWPLDLVTAAVSVALPVVCLARRWCAIPLRAASAIVLLLALFLTLPTSFKGTSDLDTRFVVMAAFVLSAALVPVALPRRAAQAICIGFLLLFSARMTVVMIAWQDWANELAGFRTVTAQIRPGDVVLTARVPGGKRQLQWTSFTAARRLSDGTVVDFHLPALLVIEHRAWWPFLFDNKSQQPIEKREPYRSLAVWIDSAPDPIGLLAGDPPELRLVTHVLLYGHGPFPLEIAGLKPLAENSAASLFAVDRGEFSRSSQLAPLPGR